MGFKDFSAHTLSTSRAPTGNSWRAHQTDAVAKGPWRVAMAMSQEDGTPSRSPSFHQREQGTISFLDGDLTGIPVPLRGSTTQRPSSGNGAPTVWG
jgi:hypothetical protein